ncbi:MAG: putative secreted protein [Proteiniphilum sp.]|nr:putative secreted protein [Proteiniphilum sp.]
MKRKNLFFVSALILFGLANVNSMKAESDDATVNIKFRPIQSIVVNPDQKTVDLLYATTANYANGVSAEMLDHLEVFSTGGFIVQANTGEDFTRVGGGTIPASDVILKATQGTGTSIGSFTNVSLSTTPTTLISATEGGTTLKYNVTYDNTTAGGSNNYINKYVYSDSPESVYTATVTYTIAAN